MSYNSLHNMHREVRLKEDLDCDEKVEGERKIFF